MTAKPSVSEYRVALGMALPLLREDLRQLIECEAAGGFAVAPAGQPLRLEELAVGEAARLIRAIREVEALLPRAPDSAPAWLDEVIDGKRTIEAIGAAPRKGASHAN